MTFDLRGTKARYLGDGPSKQEFFTMQVIICSLFYIFSNDFFDLWISPSASECLHHSPRTILTRCYGGELPDRSNITVALIRECSLKGCLSPEFNPESHLFKYMGTVASVRDFIALSDHLQGPCSPVNFWRISHGSIIGSYLINSEY